MFSTTLNLLSSRRTKLAISFLLFISQLFLFVHAKTEIPGYTHGSQSLATAPFSLEDITLLQKTMLITEDDIHYLRMSKNVLAPQTEKILDVWYGFVGSNPHLLQYFSKKGKPDGEYLARVRKRFSQWILDTADAKFDQAWLNYQYEIGRRHHRVAKNKIDKAAAIDHIHFRYLSALVIPVTTTLKPFLTNGGHDKDTVNKMHQAWVKSILLQTILWSYPYINSGDF